MKEMKGWGGRLGAVETIFEEETEEFHHQQHKQCLSPPLSPPLSSPSTPDLQSSIDAWTQMKGRRPDVKIHVNGICFDLHKDVLCSKSGYFKRRLTEISDLVLSPPLKISPETFNQIAEFCYTSDVIITPFTVAALRTAAELLEMNGGRDGESLRQKTESYFCLVVAVNRDFATAVFKSCLSLLPEAEETAFLASRCLQVLCSSEEEEETEVRSYADGIKTVLPEDFLVIADSMRRRFTRNHDFLYTVVDLYLKEYTGKMSEDQKTHICNSIDCNVLSPQLLMHAVQNPRMPLRFVVQAMLTEQLNTHRCIFTAKTATATEKHERVATESQQVTTLGAILQRDAALRQVAQLKAAMDTTTSRVQTLEEELSSMKRRLIESERRRSVMVESSRPSSSCRFSKESVNKIERGERGSVSSGSLPFRAAAAEEKGGSGVASDVHNQQHKNTALSRKLMKGLKSVFRVSTLKDSKVGATGREGGEVSIEDGKGNGAEANADECVGGETEIQDVVPSHSRNRSSS